LTRERLPNRRGAEMVDFVHGNRCWTACVGRFEDGRLAEIFIEGPKDSPLLALARDAAILASIALQFGAPAAVIHHALAGREIGPLAAALALIDGFSASGVTVGKSAKKRQKTEKGTAKKQGLDRDCGAINQPGRRASATPSRTQEQWRSADRAVDALFFAEPPLSTHCCLSRSTL